MIVLPVPETLAIKENNNCSRNWPQTLLILVLLILLSLMKAQIKVVSQLITVIQASSDANNNEVIGGQYSFP